MLLEHAGQLRVLDEPMALKLQPEVLSDIVGRVPDSWLVTNDAGGDAKQVRAAYTKYLVDRAQAPRPFLPEARGAD